MVQITTTCADYRAGRRLLALKQQLEQDQSLDPQQRAEIQAEVEELERQLGMS